MFFDCERREPVGDYKSDIARSASFGQARQPCCRVRIEHASEVGAGNERGAIGGGAVQAEAGKIEPPKLILDCAAVEFAQHGVARARMVELKGELRRSGQAGAGAPEPDAGGGEARQ